MIWAYILIVERRYDTRLHISVVLCLVQNFFFFLLKTHPPSGLNDIHTYGVGMSIRMHEACDQNNL